MDIATLLPFHFLYPAKEQTLADILPVLVTKIISKNNRNLRFENKNKQEIGNPNDPKFPK